MMKSQSQSITDTYRKRKLIHLVTALFFVANLLSLPNVSAQESEQAAASSISPTSEVLEVDSSLFTSQSFDWFDSQRQRQVPAKLYLPSIKPVDGSLPLVIFSHGIGGSKEGYSYLGRYFAAHGYASLHVQHVGSDRQLWSGNPFSLVFRLNNAAQDTEALNRVQDLRYSLDQLLSSAEGALFDIQRIIAAGHSYGANTAMLIAGALVKQQGQIVSLKDSRISAAILISAPPFYGMGDPKKILASIGIPTLHITATADDIKIPGYYSGLQDRIDIFQAIGNDNEAPKVIAVFKDGSHSIFTDRKGTGGINLNPKVKIATRQLAMAFLDALKAKNYQALDAWPVSNAAIISTFEKRLP